MQLNSESINKLCEIINGDNSADYRKGYQLVEFFNSIGFCDEYGSGFPSRWEYTHSKLVEINGTPKMESCIRKEFSVISFIERIPYLDSMISTFNQYLAFDKIKMVRNNDEIIFQQLERVIIEEPADYAISGEESTFLSKEFNADFDNLQIPDDYKCVITERVCEAEQCANNGAPLAATIMIGSILEAVLLFIANAYPRQFNQATCSPKETDTGRVKPFAEWTLNNLIDVAAEIGILKRDVKEFSHTLRNFRNYIHPNEQLRNGFTPSQHTTAICMQVLKAAIAQIGEYRNTSNGGNQ